jgi:hypothetical protein
MNLTMVRLAVTRTSAVMPLSVTQMPANIVSDWFTDLANSMSESFANTRVEIVKQLAKTSLPTVDELQSKWYLLGLGGAYGLATKLIMLVLVTVALVMVLTPLSNHSLRVRRTAQSFFAVGLFGPLFFPLYSLAYNGVQAGCQGLINIALGKSSSSLSEAAAAMLAILLPGDVWFKLIVSFFGMIFAYLAFSVALVNYLAVLATSMVYPIALALRPVAEKFNSIFHAANSAFITTLLTPFVITVGFLLPTFAAKMIPGIGATGIAAGIFTVLGAAVAFFGPIAVAIWAFKASNRVFGQLDFASIGGSVDVDSLPPVTSRDMDNSVKESAFKAFSSSFIPGAATADLKNSDDLIGDLKSLAIEGGSAAAAAAGHPWVAGALNAVDTTLSKEKRVHNSQQNMPPPTGQPVAPSGPPPAQPPTNQSPVSEWPDRK